MTAIDRLLAEPTSRCETCRWWNRLDPGHTFADCHRMPPANTIGVHARNLSGDRVEVSMSTYPHASWPNTAATDFCGEHRARAVTHG